MTPHRWRIEPNGGAYCLNHGCERTYEPPRTVSAFRAMEAAGSLRNRYRAYYRDRAAEIKALRRSLGWPS